MVEIVRAEERHFPELLEVWKEFMDFHQGIDSYLTRAENGHVNFASHIKELMQSDDNLLLVALDEGHVIGYALSMVAKRPPVFATERYGMLSDMAVTARYRRHGVGEHMLSEIVKWFRDKGIDRIELSVVAHNPVGLPFWRKQGFKDYLCRLYRDI